MGFFDFLKRRKFDDTFDLEQSASTPLDWHSRFQDFHDWGDDKKTEVGIEFLSELAANLDSVNIRRTPEEAELNPYEVVAHYVELRGRLSGIPLRVTYAVTLGTIKIETRYETVDIDEILLWWDPRKRPVQGTEDDWEEMDIRVFVAKGVFVEGSKEEVNQILNSLSVFPPDLGAEVVALMQRLRLAHCSISDDETLIEFTDNVRDMDNPLSGVREVTELVTKIATTISSGAPIRRPDPQAPVVAQMHLVRCDYCSGIFNLATNSRCPNCGAAKDE